MPTVEELERSGLITQLKPEVLNGRVTFNEADWEAFLVKINTLLANHAKANLPGGPFVSLRREFMQVAGVEVSRSFINSVIKLTCRPTYRSRNSHGWKFVAWVLALPMDYVIPVELVPIGHCPTHHQVAVRAIPEKNPYPKQRSVFEIFVDEHAHEIQEPLINAWKDITSLYNIEVILASLRRMGLNDAAIAALSRAASK